MTQLLYTAVNTLQNSASSSISIPFHCAAATEKPPPPASRERQPIPASDAVTFSRACHAAAASASYAKADKQPTRATNNQTQMVHTIQRCCYKNQNSRPGTSKYARTLSESAPELTFYTCRIVSHGAHTHRVTAIDTTKSAANRRSFDITRN